MRSLSSLSKKTTNSLHFGNESHNWQWGMLELIGIYFSGHWSTSPEEQMEEVNVSTQGWALFRSRCCHYLTKMCCDSMENWENLVRISRLCKVVSSHTCWSLCWLGFLETGIQVQSRAKKVKYKYRYTDTTLYHLAWYIMPCQDHVLQIVNFLEFGIQNWFTLNPHSNHTSKAAH